MKKIFTTILFVFFSQLQLFAVECTEKEYEHIFNNQNEYLDNAVSNLGENVIFKKSIKYDKDKQTIKVWTVSQLKTDEPAGFFKIYREFDIKNNKYRTLDSIKNNCDGSKKDEYYHIKDETWKNIPPSTVVDITLNTLKRYLNIN